MLYTPYYSKKEFIDNFVNRSFHNVYHSNATLTVRGLTTQHHILCNYSYSNTQVTYGLPLMLQIL